MKITNKQIAKVFSKAVSYLNKKGGCNHKETYICYAIEQSYYRSNIPYEQKNAAITVIQTRLSPFNNLEDWLVHQGVDFDLLLDNIGDPTREMQQHRFKWLKMLIKEFENKKD